MFYRLVRIKFTFWKHFWRKHWPPEPVDCLPLLLQLNPDGPPGSVQANPICHHWSIVSVGTTKVTKFDINQDKYLLESIIILQGLNALHLTVDVHKRFYYFLITEIMGIILLLTIFYSRTRRTCCLFTIIIHQKWKYTLHYIIKSLFYDFKS